MGDVYPHSASSGVSVAASSRPTSQPNSDDESVGGITDDAREREEQGNLSGNAMHTEALKNYYGGRSNASETRVSNSLLSMSTNLDFAAHVAVSLNRSTLWPALSQLLQFPASSSQIQVPTPLLPMCGGKVTFVLVIFLVTSRATSPQSSPPDSMNSLGHFQPGSNQQTAIFRDCG